MRGVSFRSAELATANIVIHIHTHTNKQNKTKKKGKRTVFWLSVGAALSDLAVWPPCRKPGEPRSRGDAAH